MTQREYDTNGWFEVKENPLTCVGVFPYLGSSIGSGANPHRIYNVFRPAEELSDPATLESFRLCPLIDEHEMLGGGFGVDAGKREVSGVIGDNVFFRDGKVYGNLKVFSEGLANQIDDGKQELSLGYRCVYEASSGVYNGQEYDYIQRTIRGNHVALVEAGRMGKEVAVLDSADINFENKGLSAMTKALKLARAKDLAKQFVAAMDELDVDVGDEEIEITAKKAEDEDDETKAKDEDDKSKKTEDEEVEVKAEDEDDETKAKDEDDKSKKTEDEEVEVKAEDEDGKKTSGMDAALRRQVKNLTAQVNSLKASAVTMDSVIQDTSRRDALAAKVRPHIGVFNHGSMTFDGALKYVTSKLGLRAPAGHEETAINSYLAAKAPAVALDSAKPSRKKSGSVSEYLTGGK